MKFLLSTILLLGSLACRTNLYYVEYPKAWPTLDQKHVLPRDRTGPIRIAIFERNEIKGIRFMLGPEYIATELAVAGYLVDFFDFEKAKLYEHLYQDDTYTLIVTYDYKAGGRIALSNRTNFMATFTMGLIPIFTKEYDMIELQIFARGTEGQQYYIQYANSISYGIFPWLIRPYLHYEYYSSCIFNLNFEDRSPERNPDDLNIQIANLIVREGQRILENQAASESTTSR